MGRSNVDLLDANKLCEKLSLGTLAANPQEVAGGLIHRLWRITTSEGIFAVKQLNPERLQMPGAWQRHQVTEQIATRFADHGLPAVTALKNGDDYVHRIDQLTLIVYPWTVGNMIPSSEATPEQCWQIGFALGRIHRLQLTLPELGFTFAFPYPSFPEEHWKRLSQRARKSLMPWTETIEQFLPKLAKYNSEYSLSGQELKRITVVSHRDLDQKNTLWSNLSSFKIIDWEAAGLINPTMELFAAALNWSGLRAGQCHEEAFNAVLRGYHDAGARAQTSARIAFCGCVGKWFNWLEYNLQRSLILNADSGSELKLALTEIDKAVAILRLLETHKQEWIDWLDAAKIS